ncbi:hypothetical protein KOW79_018902 [Hemibagrus wyckioides]|uniref:Uncharacterized protein n=1 Tax=Hemibagrus wyckioides TaxID=337641 RepID=A0A9D3NBG4_9TELE|nr:uncharacterized protein C8orf76 [Hemibagrus wyckioides]KAG7317867.1 hypothetical protein KOW79_018902 [Hemibagrus wyckioides]
MEIFGSTFDDSVFEESRNRDLSTDLPVYTPKTCEPEWFCHHEKFEDELDEQKTMKFRADLKYRQKQYQEAIKDYTACLPLVPNNNLSMKRDVLEGIARCYSHLGKSRQALEICEKLRNEATNTCHLTCVLQLEQSIHESCGDMKSSISCLKQLCSIHPFNPWHWMNLAVSYQSLLEASTSLEEFKETSQTPQAFIQQQEEETDVQLKACMCFIRTRLLIEILKIQQFSFVLERSKKTLQAVEASLQTMQLKQETLRLISEVMAEDLNPEKMREEKQDGEGLLGLTIKDFEKRWWNKLHACLLRKENRVLSSDKETETG